MLTAALAAPVHTGDCRAFLVLAMGANVSVQGSGFKSYWLLGTRAGGRAESGAGDGASGGRVSCGELYLWIYGYVALASAH